MKITKLKLENFLSYEKSEVTFNNGLYHISGWNKDLDRANGAGKSGIVDGICWGLFGETPRKSSADGIVNQKANKKCLVEVFIEEGRKYHIIRGRKPNVLDFFVDGEKRTGVSIVETQQLIEKELGITYTLFIHSVYFAQNSQIQFITANDQQKKDLLTELLNLSVFDKIHEKLQSELKEIDVTSSILQKEIEGVDSVVKTHQNNYHEYQRLHKEWEVGRVKRLAETDAKIEGVKQRFDKDLSEKQSKKTELESQLNEWNTGREQVVSKVSKLEEEKKQIQSQVLQYESQLQSLHEKEKEEILEESRVLNEIDLKIKQFQFQVDSIKNEVLVIVNEIQRVEKLGEGSCPICYQAISTSILQGVIEQKSRDAYQRVLDRQSIEKNIEGLKTSWVHQRAEYELNTCSRLEKKNQLVCSLNDKKKILLEYDEALSHNHSGLRQYDQAIVRVMTELKNIVDWLGRTEQLFSREVEGFKNQKLSIEMEKSQYLGLMKDAETKIVETQQKNVSQIDELKRLRDSVGYKLFLKEAFSNKGIKAYVFEQVVNEINHRTNEYLSYLFNNDVVVEFQVKDTRDTSGNLKHKFETKISFEGQNKEFGLFSGGEKRMIILAVDLALSQIIQHRSAKSVGLLVFDEYFEGLDFLGKEKMMELLKTVEGVTTLVIDHNSQFQNLFDFEIKVEKEGGVSKIL